MRTTKVIMQVIDSDSKVESANYSACSLAPPTDLSTIRIMVENIVQEVRECIRSADPSEEVDGTLLRRLITAPLGKVKIVRDYCAGYVHHDALASRDQKRLISDLQQASSSVATTVSCQGKRKEISSNKNKFSPRYLSYEYVTEMFDMARDLHYGLDCFENFKIERQKPRFDQMYNIINQDNELMKVMFLMNIKLTSVCFIIYIFKVIFFQLAQPRVSFIHRRQDSDLPALTGRLLEVSIHVQAIDSSSWPENVIIYFDDRRNHTKRNGYDTLVEESFDSSSELMRSDVNFEEREKKEEKGTFQLLDVCPLPHYCVDDFTPDRKFFRAMHSEHKLLIEHVPPGVHVHAFSDRFVSNILLIPIHNFDFNHLPSLRVLRHGILCLQTCYKFFCLFKVNFNINQSLSFAIFIFQIYRDPPTDFKEYVKKYVENIWPRLRVRVLGWSEDCPPVFPTVNSKGFKIALKKIIGRIDTTIGFK
uniref:Mab-21 domain-containing protein n=1 Tax=Heterorhabditis bacteriophora TaxID=37862 RepID=A0A1I7XSL4_HETBA